MLLARHKDLELLLQDLLGPSLDPQEREMEEAGKDKSKLFQMLEELWNLWNGKLSWRLDCFPGSSGKISLRMAFCFVAFVLFLKLFRSLPWPGLEFTASPLPAS